MKSITVILSLRLISILVCTMTIYKCVVPKKWFDSSKDELAYVDNPVESEFPGHWLPVSLIKRIMEMRVRSTPERYNFNNKLLFKENEVSRQPLYFKKTITPGREKMLMATIKISAMPSSVKLSPHSSKLTFKDVNVQSTNSKIDVSSPIQEGKVEVTNLSRGDTTTIMAKVISTTTNTEVATDSKTSTLTETTTTKIPLTASTVVQVTESIMRNIATTTQISPTLLTTTVQLTNAEISTNSTTEITTLVNEKEMQTNKTAVPLNTTTTTKITTVTPQPITTTTSTMPTTTTETGNPFY